MIDKEAIAVGDFLPESAASLLHCLVEYSKQEKVKTVDFHSQSDNNEYGSFLYRFGNTEWTEGIKGTPMTTFECLGLVIRRTDSRRVFVTPLAYDVDKYTQKGRFGKWFVKVWYRINEKGIALFAAFVALASLALTMLKMFDIIVGLMNQIQP